MEATNRPVEKTGISEKGSGEAMAKDSTAHRHGVVPLRKRNEIWSVVFVSLAIIDSVDG